MNSIYLCRKIWLSSSWILYLLKYIQKFKFWSLWNLKIWFSGAWHPSSNFGMSMGQHFAASSNSTGFASNAPIPPMSAPNQMHQQKSGNHSDAPPAYDELDMKKRLWHFPKNGKPLKILSIWFKHFEIFPKGNIKNVFFLKYASRNLVIFLKKIYV